jgi:hypothetical protein
MDSNIALRRVDHGDGEPGEKVSRLEGVADVRVGTTEDWPFGSLMMSRRVEENVD